MKLKVRICRPAVLYMFFASIVSCGNDGPTEPAFQTPARITLSTVASTLTAVGDSIQLVAEVMDREGKVIQGAAVTWTSSNPSVVQVDDRGLATALTSGYVHITAVSGSVNAVASIIVMQVPDRIEVLPSTSVLAARGETVQLAYTVYDSNGAAIPGAGVVWASGDDTVATVSAVGLVTAVGQGSTLITASSGDVRGEASIRVAGSAGKVMFTP